MKIKCYLLVFYSIIFLTSGNFIFSQSAHINSYKVIKNRKNIQVNAICQDNKGYLWIGTNQGLVKYDGLEFNLFTQNDSLTENIVTALNTDTSGVLWIGHQNGGISKYKDGQIQKFIPEEGLPGVAISSFFVDYENTLWFSTPGEGAYFYKGVNRKRLYNINADNGLTDNYVYSITQDSTGTIYLGTDKGITVFNIKTGKVTDKISMSNGLPDNIVKHIHIHHNYLIIGMEDAGICWYNINNKSFTSLKNWTFGPVNDFVTLPDNNLIISTKENGIIKCKIDSTSGYSIINKNSGLPESKTRTVFADQEGNIWIGLKDELSLIRDDKFEFLDSKNGFDLKNIYSITIDKQGNYWIAAKEGLFWANRDIYGNIQKKKLFDDSKEGKFPFISLFEDINGNIWAGTYGNGVLKINSITFDYQLFTTKQGLANDNVIYITGNHFGVWFCTLGGGVSKLNLMQNNELKTFNTQNGLTSNYIYSAYIDSKQRIWLATDGGGVVYIENEDVKKLPSDIADKLPKIVYSITQDHNSNFWFNCPDKGIFKFDGKELINFNETNILKTNTINGLSLEKENKIVIISNEGIDLLNSTNNTIEYHSAEDGVAYLEPNLNAVYTDYTGNKWIGTANGLVILKNSKFLKRNVSPKVFITKKSIFFNEIEDNINSFKYNQNHITFYYSGIWFKSAVNLTFRYKLEGYDIDWNAETQLRMVTYSNLPAGKYKFVVEVKEGANHWKGSTDAVFQFTVHPPFWRTTWFITLSIIIIILSIYLIFRIRLKNLKRAKDFLEEEVKRRTSEIRKQKEEIEAQRDEIETQKNYVIEQRDQIEKQNLSITSSIQYASKIQNAVLPPEEDFKELLGEYFVFYKPRDIVSGDFYYLTARENHIIIAAADSTGHGVPGAFMSMLGITLIGKIVTQEHIEYKADIILNNLRDEIKKSLRQTGKEGEAKDGMDIALCIINKHTKIAHFAGAYNPLIIVRDKQLIVYKGDRMPIGIFIKEKTGFTNHQIELQKGDMLYMFSDGFQDQSGGHDNSKFKSSNLKDLLVEIADKNASQQKQIISDTFTNWKGNEDQVDDILILGFRI